MEVSNWNDEAGSDKEGSDATSVIIIFIIINKSSHS